MLTMGNEMSFVEILAEEMAKRNWAQADLARAAGLKRAVISKTLNQTSTPTPETLTAIAKALNKPPDVVFRCAGLLPQKNDEDEKLLEELNFKLSQLPPDLQEEAMRYLEFLLEKQEQKKRGNHLDLKKPMGAPHTG